MNFLKKIYCRCFQTALYLALPVLPYRNPEVLNRMEQIPDILERNGVKKPMVVTDGNLSASETAERLREILQKTGFSFAWFDKTFPNPTTALAWQGADFYRENSCDGLIAFGGGSPMDLAKAVGICVVRPKKPIEKFAGILKVHCKLPLLVAIPTTAGTGSETTLSAVLIEEKTLHKFAVNDFPLIPRYAVLDAAVVHTLPEEIAAQTGLDALTHAVEAYIGRSTTRRTRNYAEMAVRMIFESLDDAVHHRSETAEKSMLLASHYAGRAFTRSYVGYVHALSHSLSGRYNLSHGKTNATLLPVVLRRYGTAAEKRLARLAVCAGLGTEGEGNTLLAERFIAAIGQMNRRYRIPELKEADIPRLAAYAEKEANPLYPVPVLWGKEELEEIYRQIKG